MSGTPFYKLQMSVLLLSGFLSSLTFQFYHQLIQLSIADGGRCIVHHIATGIVLRESDYLPDRIQTGKQRNPTIKTKSNTAMRSAPYLKAFIRKPN